jgi:hypothetical protein
MVYSMKKLFLALVLCPFFFGSCASRINGVVQEGGSADLTIQAALQPQMTSMIRNLRAMMGEGGSNLILDGRAISRSMAASPGIGSVSLNNTGPAALEGKIIISRLEDFLSTVKEKRFITYSEGSTNGRPGGYIIISLDRDTVPDLIALLAAEARDYLFALMAPVVTGEDISKPEYLALVGSLYGAGFADEIRNSRILASIGFPGPITAIRGGAFSGNLAQFELSLLDLLVLESPMSWDISWQR